MKNLYEMLDNGNLATQAHITAANIELTNGKCVVKDPQKHIRLLEELSKRILEK